MPSIIGVKRISPLSRLLIVILIALLFSCSGGREHEQKALVRDIYKPDTLSFLIKYESSLFPLPSPYQVSHLVKQHGIPFNESILNKPENIKLYTTSFKKALNLGVYGTNLSYLNIYERTPQSIAYLAVLKKLSEDLNLTPAFNESFYMGIEKNIGSKDSLLVLLSRSYRKADSYLRENDRSEIGALILTGGWVESVFVLTRLAKSTSNREIINRVGEQKHPLDNLIEVLTPLYYKSPEYSKLIDMFIDLAYEFDGIIYSYSYREPKIDEENKIIYINSQSRVTISEHHLNVITKKVEAIRNMIVE
jgi:hypothetical protein